MCDSNDTRSNMKRSISPEESCEDFSTSKKTKICQQCTNLGNDLSELSEKLDRQEALHKNAMDNLNAKLDKMIRLLSDLTDSKKHRATKILEKQDEPSNLEAEWGQNSFLLGDGIISMLLKVPEIKEKIDKMKKTLHMSVRAKDKATIASLYDRSRDKLLFPLPSKVSKVILMIGSQDLFDDSLTTLRQASLEEVKQRNRSKLKEKASNVKAMVMKLLQMNMSVVLVVPATSVKRTEVFQHFEEVIEESCEDLPFPHFKLLSLPKLMYNKFPPSAENSLQNFLHLCQTVSNLLFILFQTLNIRRF